MGDDWITTAEAVRLSEYQPDHLRRLIRAGEVEARKFGHVWQVSRCGGYLTHPQLFPE